MTKINHYNNKEVVMKTKSKKHLLVLLYACILLTIGIEYMPPEVIGHTIKLNKSVLISIIGILVAGLVA